MKSRKPAPISVTEAKAKLLEIIRNVEGGQSFEITKAGRVVARILPPQSESLPRVGFAEGAVTGDLINLPEMNWTFDSENLTRPPTKRK